MPNRLRQSAMLMCMALLLVAPPMYARELVLVTNVANNLSSLDSDQLSNLYLGRKKSVDGVYLKLYDLPLNSSTRAAFFRKLNGMTLSQVNAYWARLKFTGRVFPPQEVLDEQAVLKAIKNNPGALGYVCREALTDDVKVVEWRDK